MDWNQGLSWWQAIMPHSLPWISSEIGKRCRHAHRIGTCSGDVSAVLKSVIARYEKLIGNQGIAHMFHIFHNIKAHSML
jgi:hypothetical protein